LLVQGIGFTVTGDRFTLEEPLDMGDTSFAHYSSQDLLPGDVLVASFSGLPTAGNQASFLWVALMLALLTGAFGWFYLKRKRQIQPVPLADGPAAQRQKLIIKIAHLDDDYESGKIPEEVYRQQRAAIKARILALAPKSTEERGL
ncbi:MAG: LPXTG cell wall anchor domain-containing protein, partial [Dehalococcoidia bacterium]|nr:LPXTG cell wall anchor domain-containing protein [Dehalococcoidia bacterium]